VGASVSGVEVDVGGGVGLLCEGGDGEEARQDDEG
jgi:hypothetical protein